MFKSTAINYKWQYMAFPNIIRECWYWLSFWFQPIDDPIPSPTPAPFQLTPSPTPVPIQLTPSPILPTETDNHRIDVEEDGSLKLSILIKESLKRTKPKDEQNVDTPRKGHSKPKFASFPTRIPHTLGPIPETTPTSKPLRTTPKFQRHQNSKKRKGNSIIFALIAVSWILRLGN